MRFVERAVGIDLGTTHSEVALLDPSEKDLVIWADKFGRKTMPSAVAWDPATERFLVGRAARARRGTAHPPVESIKRKMGQDVRVELGPHRLTPEEVSAKILGELVSLLREDLAQRAPAGTEARITRAVITVPAYFDAPQIDATRRAGELAGLEVIGILQEPTAAALYHQWKHRLPDGYRLVYDLGGGTFDVSVLRAVAGEHRVIAIDGDNYLGGDDFDRRFAERLRQRLVERGYALELGDGEEDRLRRVRLVQLAQEAKEQLSSSEVVHLSRPAWLVDQRDEPVDVDLEVARSEHEASIADLVEATLARAELALSRAKETAGIGIEDIEHVLLVGGSTRVPLVERRVHEALAARTKGGARPLASEVDTSVALGAALYAATLGGLRLGLAEAGVDRAVLRAEGPLSTAGERLKVTLASEAAPERAAELVVQDGDAELVRTALEDGRARVRFEVRLEAAAADGARELACRFVSAEGEPLTELPLLLWRADVGPRPSALSRAAVVAKDLAIEVARAGRTERKVLVPRGATLPASVTADLFTGDRSGMVVLRLYSGLLPIQTLALEVPEGLPERTKVVLELRVSESMALDAKATVAGRELWSRIEPGKAASTPDREHIESLLARGEALARTLWGHRRMLFGWSFGPLAAGLREASTNDPDRTRALAAQLEQLLEESGDAEGLSPPWEHFAQTLDVIRRIAFRGGGLLGQDAASWDQRIAALEARGHEAQRAEDAAAWRAVTQEAQALEETAATQAHASLDVNDPTYVRLRWAALRRHVQRVEERIAEVVPASSPELRERIDAERARLVGQLRAEVKEPLAALEGRGGSDPAAVRKKVAQLDGVLDRIEAVLDRLPQLGLVTDREK